MNVCTISRFTVSRHVCYRQPPCLAEVVGPPGHLPSLSVAVNYIRSLALCQSECQGGPPLILDLQEEYVQHRALQQYTRKVREAAVPLDHN